jgi:mycothiol synthase
MPTMAAVVRPARASDEAGLRDVMEASLATDAIPGFLRSDIERALIRIVPDPAGTVVALEDGRVVGYCTPHHDDLTVHPAFRRRGHARRLVPAAIELARERGHDELQLYVPSHLPASQAFAAALGFRYRSSLWQFRLRDGHMVSEPHFPPEVVTRPFDPTLDGDIDAWVAFMLAAFDGHPTPMTWTPAVIAHVNASSDFDPTAILLVAPADDPTRPVGFARIETAPDEAGAVVGDVGLIGVLPAWRGRGLGRELLRWSVTDLRRRGAKTIELSVEAANERATTLYRAHGFEPAIEWPHWVLPAR